MMPHPRLKTTPMLIKSYPRRESLEAGFGGASGGRVSALLMSARL